MKPALLAATAFLVAGGLAGVAAHALAAVVEERSVVAVREVLADEGHGWASVVGDGLQVVIEGEAPSEAGRFRAMSDAASVVDASRVIDNMRVAASLSVAPPAFAVEILRNDAGVTLIGLMPEGAATARLASGLADAAAGQEVTDLLRSADYPTPEGWEEALAFAVEALADLPRARVSVGPGRVAVEAIADSPAEKARIETALARARPEGVALELDVSAPRPVIAPFTLRFTLGEAVASFDACSADTEAAREAILAAAVAAGAEGRIDCRLGLGAPSPLWGEAAARAIAGLAEMGGGTLTLSDADVTLLAAPGTDPALFDRVAGEVAGALPASFAFAAELPEAAPREEGPAEFTARLTEEGAVRLSGRLADAGSAETVATYARARFGSEAVTTATRVAGGDMPPGWSVRVLAGLDALARLGEGSVVVTPDALVVRGRTGDEAAGDEIAAAAIATLGAGTALDIEVAYDQALDPIAALPTPEECLRRIEIVTAEVKITFDPGSATLSGEGEPVVETIAEILRACPDLRLAITGYTDSQGRDEMNEALSQDRAEAVLAALRAERVPVGGFEAVGRGEADPIASNDTEEGREANRRIEFALLGGEAPALPPDERGADPDAATPAMSPEARPEARPEAEAE